MSGADARPNFAAVLGRNITVRNGLQMNCFVIMPFAPEFEDVYATIQWAVEGARHDAPLLCFRLDESRPAGRITDRLVKEIQSAAICIADLTGMRPNIMWEVGYAMALGKPTLLVTQDESGLPFDIHDMETLRYNRDRLNSSLGQPLRSMVIDTMSTVVSESPSQSPTTTARDELLGELLVQVRELREIVGQSVRNWGPEPIGLPKAIQSTQGAQGLAGAWVNEESGTHIYAQCINGELVAPYCYSGNDELNSAYYGWTRVGEYWFARFAWLEQEISGFTFIKQESVDILSGAWWIDETTGPVAEVPDMNSGVASKWKRVQLPTPAWAERFFEEARHEGIVGRILRGGV